jgi:hypothetical protein
MRSPRTWLVVGVGVLAFGLLPILDGAVRLAVIVAGALLLLVATSRILSRRTGDGDPRGPRDTFSDPLVGRPPRRR